MPQPQSHSQQKPLDDRIYQLIARSLKKSQRSLFLMLGDRRRQQEQIVNLHYLLSQAMRDLVNPSDMQKKNPSPRVLWCSREKVDFSTNWKENEKRIKKEAKRGQRASADDLTPLESFIRNTKVRYCYYNKTESILGQTYDILILQDFEALTPNVLARTIETVQGGGIVLLLMQGMSNLRSLYSMAMDVHARYRTSTSDAEPVARFNERFLLSLGANENCLIVDDEMNVLSLSQGKNIDNSLALTGGRASAAIHRDIAQSSVQLHDLAESLKDTEGVGQIVPLCETLDQAKAVLQFESAAATKNMNQTVSLTAGRGRGKSAALGLSLALAFYHNYSNIFVTSPSPENLNTLFEFLLIGLNALGWEKNADYDVFLSTNPDWKNTVVRVSTGTTRSYRQTIQYIAPGDAHLLSQAELVVIDEAAAIPLPKVRALLGNHMVFMASTINGYEGTGRSLSLKLVQQLRQSTQTRALKEIKLDIPIRYAHGDPIERWLNHLLCLDASLITENRISSAPHPDTCELYYVNRDTLFSYHPASELFLQRMMALYVASHYKNTPNDLQLLSDAPGQHLFVLLPPVSPTDTTLPTPLVVLQVALEGNIDKAFVSETIAKGGKVMGGDLIPWTLSQQFQDNVFGTLLGARVIRIATHADFIGKGYGSRALDLLDKFYTGQLLDVDAVHVPQSTNTFEHAAKEKSAPGLRDIKSMAPLLQRLATRRPEAIDYLGVSFGVTPSLFQFWARAHFTPLYVRQVPNELTGEHTMIMLKPSDSAAPWLREYATDFERRFATLLSYAFRDMSPHLAGSVLQITAPSAPTLVSPEEIKRLFARLDLKRLDAYSRGTIDFHAVVDLFPVLATLFFQHRLGDDISLSAVQRSILVALGLQHVSVEQVGTVLELDVSQVLALLIKSVRKISRVLRSVQEADAADHLHLPDAKRHKSE